ncbi:hypothetical protein AAG906_040798 [Vitis piasezkii]
MTKKTLEKKQALRLPKTIEPSLWVLGGGVGKGFPMQSGLSSPCFIVAYYPPKYPSGQGDQKTPFAFPPLLALATFLYKPSSLLCIAFLIEVAELTPKAEFYGSTTISRRSMVEFSNMAIWEVPLRMTPVQFLQELEKHYTGNAAHPYYCLPPMLRHPFQVKYLGDIISIKLKTEGMSGTGSLLDVVQLAETLGKVGLIRSKLVDMSNLEIMLETIGFVMQKCEDILTGI